jgi:hypothetical protein
VQAWISTAVDGFRKVRRHLGDLADGTGKDVPMERFLSSLQYLIEN